MGENKTMKKTLRCGICTPCQMINRIQKNSDKLLNDNPYRVSENTLLGLKKFSKSSILAFKKSLVCEDQKPYPTETVEVENYL